jgi:DNA-binding transcriptional ArsR family regulator
VGNWLTQADGPVFPLPDAPRARFAGPVAFKAEQGRVAFVDADGTPIDLDLAATADHTLPVGETDVMHRLVFHGTVAGADLPAGDAWALAGASPVWRLQGDATWRHATGEVSSQGQVRRFTDENLTLRGAVSIRPEAPHAAAPLPGATRFEGDGAFEARVEGGAAFPAQSSPAVVAVASLGVVLATLALVAWKVLGAFYTRMAPEDALLHPRRRAIYDAALDHPGERLRDLQRRLGMAWGSFSFHVHVLVRGGHLRLRKEGAYRLVIPTASAAAAGAPVIPHPVTRLVYDAIPPDGSSLAFADLRGRLGFSRQRVNHHLAALQARGLVEVRRGPGRARDVARKAEA